MNALANNGANAHPFLQSLRSDVILADGAMGTLLYDRGISADRALSELNLSAKDVVQQAHLDYILAGADLVQTNTFGANRHQLAKYGLEKSVWDINVWGAKIARASREIAGKSTWVAGSVGPLGDGIKPWGTLSPAQAKSAFLEQIEALLAGGVDLFIIETMSDPHELLLASEVVRTVCKLPVVASMTFSHEGQTFFGADVDTILGDLFGVGERPFDVFGVNCGAGPLPVLNVVKDIFSRQTTEEQIPLAAQANAGLPKRVNGRYTYPSPPEYFGELIPDFINSGVRLVGGCCGTTPDHTRAIRHILDSAKLTPRTTTPVDTKEKTKSTDSLRSGSIELASTTPPPSPTSWVIAPEADPLLQRLAQGNVISVELDPPRGSQVDKYVEDARLLKEAGVDFINVADSPMARVRMSAAAGSLLVAQSTGISPIIHFTTRDRNLMGIQSDLLGAHALGIRHVLALTGDAPGLGNYAHATAVYDVDSIGLIEILVGLNEGRDIGGNPIGKPTEFTIGAALDLNTETPEQLEHEIGRFQNKLAAGAHFVMTQPVYEPETYLNMLDRLGGISVPVLLGVMPLHSVKHAEYLHNEVPGISVPKHIRQRLADAGDDGQRVGLELAADLIRKTAAHVSGFYIVPSFGRCGGIATLVRELREEWTTRNEVSL